MSSIFALGCALFNTFMCAHFPSFSLQDVLCLCCCNICIFSASLWHALWTATSVSSAPPGVSVAIPAAVRRGTRPWSRVVGRVPDICCSGRVGEQLVYLRSAVREGQQIKASGCRPAGLVGTQMIGQLCISCSRPKMELVAKCVKLFFSL